jgi:hypothetical protein
MKRHAYAAMISGGLVTSMDDVVVSQKPRHSGSRFRNQGVIEFINPRESPSQGPAKLGALHQRDSERYTEP